MSNADKILSTDRNGINAKAVEVVKDILKKWNPRKTQWMKNKAITEEDGPLFKEGSTIQAQKKVDTTIEEVTKNACGLIETPNMWETTYLLERDRGRNLRFMGFACNALPRSLSIISNLRRIHGAEYTALWICQTIRNDEALKHLSQLVEESKLWEDYNIERAMEDLLLKFDKAAMTTAPTRLPILVVRPGVGAKGYCGYNMQDLMPTDLVFAVTQKEKPWDEAQINMRLDVIIKRTVRAIESYNPFFDYDLMLTNANENIQFGKRAMTRDRNPCAMTMLLKTAIDKKNGDKWLPYSGKKEWEGLIDNPLQWILTNAQPAAGLEGMLFSDGMGQYCMLRPVKISNVCLAARDALLTDERIHPDAANKIAPLLRREWAMLHGPIAEDSTDAFYVNYDSMEDNDEIIDELGFIETENCIPGLTESNRRAIINKTLEVFNVLSVSKTEVLMPFVRSNARMYDQLRITKDGTLSREEKSDAFIFPPPIAWPCKARSATDMGWRGVWGITTMIAHMRVGKDTVPVRILKPDLGEDIEIPIGGEKTTFTTRMMQFALEKSLNSKLVNLSDLNPIFLSYIRQ